MSKDNHDCKCNHEHHHHGDHECGCNHEHAHDTITLTLDNDETLECVVIGIFDVDDREYIALLPNDEENVLLYRYAEAENDEVDLANIEDDDEFELVSKTFLSLIEEESDDDEE